MARGEQVQAGADPGIASGAASLRSDLDGRPCQDAGEETEDGGRADERLHDVDASRTEERDQLPDHREVESMAPIQADDLDARDAVELSLPGAAAVQGYDDRPESTLVETTHQLQ